MEWIEIGVSQDPAFHLYIADGQQLEKQVEENLRRAYRAKADEPIPDRFVELLNQLRSQEESGTK